MIGYKFCVSQTSSQTPHNARYDTNRRHMTPSMTPSNSTTHDATPTDVITLLSLAIYGAYINVSTQVHYASSRQDALCMHQRDHSLGMASHGSSWVLWVVANARQLASSGRLARPIPAHASVWSGRHGHSRSSIVCPVLGNLSCLPTPIRMGPVWRKHHLH